MSPRGYSERRIQQPCEACGAIIPADSREINYARFFCCQAVTAKVEGELPGECWINRNNGSVGCIAESDEQYARREAGNAGCTA
jgi:hypothetical protein